jgi:hypothetical protein
MTSAIIGGSWCEQRTDRRQADPRIITRSSIRMGLVPPTRSGLALIEHHQEQHQR